MNVVWIIFINLSFVLRLLGFADMCKIRAKLVHGNDMYVFTNITIFEQILNIRNTTRPHRNDNHIDIHISSEYLSKLQFLYFI